MLGDSPIVAVVAVTDLARGKEFYGGTLGLAEADVAEPGGMLYSCAGGTQLLVYESGYAGTNKATAAAWQVDDIDQEITSLKEKGIRFEHYDLPGVERTGETHALGGFRAAWFKDPDGNILNVVSRS
jgi:predicted enzyme related to lactoylglutathione lyase